MNRDLLLQLRNAIDVALEATDENVLDRLAGKSGVELIP